jgi:hypothetical protein
MTPRMPRFPYQSQGHGKVVTKGALPRRGMPGLVIEENNIQKGGIA